MENIFILPTEYLHTAICMTNMPDILISHNAFQIKVIAEEPSIPFQTGF